MKKALIVITILMLSLFTYSQSILENPKVGMCSVSKLTIEKVELFDTATVLWFHVKSEPGKWINVPKNTYIQPIGSKEKLYVLSALGIKLDEHYTMPESGEVNYKLTFPRIDKFESKIDFVDSESDWYIYDVQVKPELKKSTIPEKLKGNWFRSDNANWEISLFDSLVVYKSHVWKCQKYFEKDGLGQIKLSSKSKNLVLLIKPVENSSFLIGESPAKLIHITHKQDLKAIMPDNGIFKSPVFKADTAIFCGFIKGFNTRVPQKSGWVIIRSVLNGEQKEMLLTISDHGTFSLKIPLLYPQEVDILIFQPFLRSTIFLEPGKTTFQLIDKGNKVNPILFMGDNSRLNNDLLKLDDIISFDYDDMIKTVCDFSPQQYKVYIQDLQQKDLGSLNVFVKHNTISAKAVFIKKMDIDYSYSYNLMTYGLTIDAAYRKKNSIPQTQWKLPIKPLEPAGTYYNFLTNDLVNNPFAILSKDYAGFVFSIKLDTSLRSIPKSYLIQVYQENLNHSGRKETIDEKELTNLISQVDTIVSKKLQDEYDKIIIPFYKDHKHSIDSLYAISRFLARDEKIRKVYGIEPGFATDLIISQDFYRKVVTELTPYTEKQLKPILQKVRTPFVANYLKLKNNETKGKISFNKTKTGYTLNETPKETGDKVFDAILSKYKGKVVYVDFWATWCSPCREGIKRIKPLKEEMSGENVVFVYITDQTSPKTTYENLVPTIKGDHYRLSNDDFNILKEKFNFSGIPHQILVGKNGKIFNQKNWRPENSELKEILMKYIKE